MIEFGRVREKLKVVVDTSVFVAAIFWQGSARECLVRFARREYEIVVFDTIPREFAETAWELKLEENLASNPQPWLNWINGRATITAPVALNEPVCPDADDEKFIECAPAARAAYIVSRDRHLLHLERPFGITVVDDREFVAIIKGQRRGRG